MYSQGMMPARHTHRLSLRSLPPNGWKNSSIVSCSLSSRWYILFTPIFKVFSPKPLFLASFMIPHFWIFFSCFFPAFLCLILIFHFFSCWKVFQQALIQRQLFWDFAIRKKFYWDSDYSNFNASWQVQNLILIPRNYSEISRFTGNYSEILMLLTCKISE